MPKPLPLELRRRVVDAYNNGEGTYQELSARFCISSKSVYRWAALDQHSGDVSPKPHAGGRALKIPDAHFPMLEDLVAEKQDKTVQELSEAWKAKGNNKVSRATLGRALLRAGLSFKKKTFRAAERDREDVKAKEAVFLAEVAKVPVEKLVFIDEAGVNLGMTRTHARAPIGKRALCKRPAKQGNISLAGAVRATDMCALYAYDGPIDGDKFLSFLDTYLLPKLTTGDVVVMDNLRVHHIPEVKKRLSQVGARALYLPPYSPERNPIEETWSLIKVVFKKAEARTIDVFVDTLKAARDAITQPKLNGFFRHAGYGLPD